MAPCSASSIAPCSTKFCMRREAAEVDASFDVHYKLQAALERDKRAEATAHGDYGTSQSCDLLKCEARNEQIENGMTGEGLVVSYSANVRKVSSVDLLCESSPPLGVDVPNCKLQSGKKPNVNGSDDVSYNQCEGGEKGRPCPEVICNGHAVMLDPVVPVDGRQRAVSARSAVAFDFDCLLKRN